MILIDLLSAGDSVYSRDILLNFWGLPWNMRNSRENLLEILAVVIILSLISCVWGMTLGWLRLVGSIKLQVSFAEYSLFYRALLQKRPIILSMLLTQATPYDHLYHNSYPSCPSSLSDAKETYKRDDILQKRTIIWSNLPTVATPYPSCPSSVSDAKETYQRDDILQKRPIIWSNLLTVATPYLSCPSSLWGGYDE